MIKPSDFIHYLNQNGISFYAGVPDSLLKPFCAYLNGLENHFICANEGNAVAMAAGHFLATGNPALVYMQNSGFGNAINPILSLASPDVYALPMVLLIGWRGQPGKKDEPQHAAQGRLMEPMLKTLEIPYVVLHSQSQDWQSLAGQAIAQAKSGPAAIVCQVDTFETIAEEKKLETAQTLAHLTMSREGAIASIIARLNDDDAVVATTGKPAREVFEFRVRKSQGHERDFLTVGAMGHASQIALGIAQSQKNRKVYCLDGDGSTIMHMGALSVAGQSGLENYRHIVLNNGAHDSVGGQPTLGLRIDLCAIATACGYNTAICVETEEELERAMPEIESCHGPAFLEVRVLKGARADLGRPTSTPIQNRDDFINFLKR